MTEFRVTSRHEDGCLVVSAVGELDIATVASVREAAARRQPEECLIVDLSRLEFLDTSGIAFTVEAFHESQVQDGYELRILRAPPPVQRVFELAGLEDVLPFADAANG